MNGRTKIILCVLTTAALAGCDSSQLPINSNAGSIGGSNGENPEEIRDDAYYYELAQTYERYVPELPFGAVQSPEDYISEGRWGAIIPWPQIATGAANLPDGRIVTWSSTSVDDFGGQNTFTHGSVFDPTTTTFTPADNPAHNSFCAGVSMLSDGRPFAAGGGATITTTSVYNESSNSWSLVDDMVISRWYPTSTTLPTGQVLTSLGTKNTPYSELWTENEGWDLRTNVSLQPILDDESPSGNKGFWFPAMNVAPNGTLFHPGPTSEMFSIDLNAPDALISYGKRENGDPHRLYNTTVMYDIGKMLLAGGGEPALASAMTIDLNGSVPVVSAANPMNFARSMQNSVVLPSGDVLVIGGNSSGKQFSDEGTQITPEVWNPDTGIWTNLADLTEPRNYHSTALLLKDGRVAAMGGGLCGGCQTNYQTGQIFEPPYLFNTDGTPAARPSINNNNAVASAGDVITLNGTADMTSFSMVRLVALTHHHTTDQRRIPLDFQSDGNGSYQLQIPSNTNVVIPGNYWIFGMNAQGVPSIGSTIKVEVTDLTTVIALPNENSVSYEYFEGEWNQLPNFNSLTPVSTGILDNFLLTPAQQDDNFGFRFTAKIDVPQAGVYTFYTNSDDGSQLFIDGQMIVDNDGVHSPNESNGTIQLSAGEHDIVVTYFEKAGGSILAVNWQGPGFGKENIATGLIGSNSSTTPVIPPVVPVDPVDPVDPDTNDDKNISYEYYHGQWNLLPDFDSLTPVSTGTLDEFVLTPAQRANSFGFRYSAKLNVDNAGDYTFYTSSDDGSQLFINGTLVVDNDGLHGTRERQGTLQLGVGQHDVVVTYFERFGRVGLSVNWEGPGITKQSLSDSLIAADSTVDPVTPVDPVIPVDPIDPPVDPVSPVDPIDPFTPIDPAGPVPGNLITNSMFEVDANHWAGCAVGTVISLTSDSASGDSALSVAGCAYDEFPIVAGETYTLNCAANASSSSFASLTLNLSDSTYTALETSSQVITQTGYNNYQIELTAPANSSIAAVTVYSEGGDVRIDNCTVVPNSQGTGPINPIDTTAVNLLPNSDFETDLSGWSACQADTVLQNSTNAASGNGALAITGCAFDEFDITAGKTYRFSCSANGNGAVFSDMTMSFTDSTYVALATESAEITGATGYSIYTIEATAPAGSEIGVIDLYSEGNSSALFDACSVIEVAP